MHPLSKDLRNLLAKVVLEARDAAETGAQKALHTLGVDEPDAPSHLKPEQRELRRALRAQAHQLGDGENPEHRGTYSVWHLMEKIAYDQWHRMLFARFLAENNLLISPQHQVAVTLDDCNDLAPELGLRDGWQVAAHFASEMLPQIFRTDDPAGQIIFAPEDQTSLQQKVINLPQEIFLSDDALGWVYQFWQAKKKDEVNLSEEKIGADELASVTQLFTEDYMVQFLLHNTLGAWWTARCRSEGKNPSLRNIEFTYLRILEDNSPAAGPFNMWPHTAREIRVLDPCMGSGHFLTFALPILAAIRVEEERLSETDAYDAVLRDNLFGLELDPRCTQIAAFNLALAVWKITGFHKLPQLNLACCGLGINTSKEDWIRLAGDDDRLIGGMERLYDLFQQAPILGSLINPRRVGESQQRRGVKDLLGVDFKEIKPLFEKAFSAEKIKGDDSLSEIGVTALGLTRAAEILSSQFTLIATNVPYLGRNKQDDVLKSFCEFHFPNSKADLAICFLERCLSFNTKGGTIGIVAPQNWLFLSTYKRIRQYLIKTDEWNFVVKLGPHAFETIGGEVVNVALIAITHDSPNETHQFHGMEVSQYGTPVEKSVALHNDLFNSYTQMAQLKNPDARIILGKQDAFPLLEQYATTSQGLKTGDDPRFRRNFWELSSITKRWRFFQTSGTGSNYIDGLNGIIDWSDEGASMARLQGLDAWGKRGAAVGIMNNLFASYYTGEIFDSAISPIIPNDPSDLLPILLFCDSQQYRNAVRNIDTKVAVTNATLVKVPCDLNYWRTITLEKYPERMFILASDDPTQWLFSGHPKDSAQPLQVALIRLLGYRWPRLTGSNLTDCPELNPDGIENHVDNDGIVCINSIKGEQTAIERLRALLAFAYSSEWSVDKQAELLKQMEFKGESLEDWLRNGFFEQHCQLFHQRPFIWHIWDGRKDGFSVLVNYHKLNKPTLEKLTYTYLGDWIVRQKAAVGAGEEGSDARLEAAIDLKNKLEKIIEGEQPYDIFVRWKPIEKQPIGWNPDLNDGVRLNIRPFVIAGVLRKNPNINWNKDRGKDVQSAPWYHLFKGDRINDHHLTLEEKRKARQRS